MKRDALLSRLIFTLFMITAQSIAQAENILAANYDVLLNIGETEWQIQSQAQVRSGNAIPVDFGQHKVDLRITADSATNYSVVVSLSENTEDGWYLVTTTPPRFEGEFAIPVQFAWSSGDVALDIAIAVSPAK